MIAAAVIINYCMGYFHINQVTPVVNDVTKKHCNSFHYIRLRQSTTTVLEFRLKLVHIIKESVRTPDKRRFVYQRHCLLYSVFSKRWLVYAAGTNSDVCARNSLYPVFLLTKTPPRGFYQWIFIKETPLPDWQGFCKCVLF